MEIMIQEIKNLFREEYLVVLEKKSSLYGIGGGLSGKFISIALLLDLTIPLGIFEISFSLCLSLLFWNLSSLACEIRLEFSADVFPPNMSGGGGLGGVPSSPPPPPSPIPPLPVFSSLSLLIISLNPSLNKSNLFCNFSVSPCPNFFFLIHSQSIY